MGDWHEYYDLANALGWFAVAGIVFLDIYIPTSEDIVVVGVGLGILNLVRQIASK